MASVWKEILDAVGTRLSGLSWATTTGITMPSTATVREDAQSKQGDALPFLLVTKGGAESVIDSTFTDIVWESYPVLALLILEFDRTYALVANELSNRQLINDKLDARPPLTGVTTATVTDVDLRQLDLFDYKATPGTVYKVLGVLATYTTYRVRTHP